MMLDARGINVTAIIMLSQVQSVVDAVNGGGPVPVSVFFGPIIADTGTDPMPLMAQAVHSSPEPIARVRAS